MQESSDISSEVQRSAQSGERDLWEELLAEIEVDSLINSFKELTEPAPIATEVKVDSWGPESSRDLEEEIEDVWLTEEEEKHGLDALVVSEEVDSLSWESEIDALESESSEDSQVEVEDALDSDGEEELWQDASVVEEEDIHGLYTEEDE